MNPVSSWGLLGIVVVVLIVFWFIVDWGTDKYLEKYKKRRKP